MIYGHTQNYYQSVYTSKLSNRNDAGLAGIPDIYTTNRDVNPDYWMYGALSNITAPFFKNGRIELPQQIDVRHPVGQHAADAAVSRAGST